MTRKLPTDGTTRQCPSCGMANAPCRLYCRHCHRRLFSFDDAIAQEWGVDRASRWEKIKLAAVPWSKRQCRKRGIKHYSMAIRLVQEASIEDAARKFREALHWFDRGGDLVQAHRSHVNAWIYTNAKVTDGRIVPKRDDVLEELLGGVDAIEDVANPEETIPSTAFVDSLKRQHLGETIETYRTAVSLARRGEWKDAHGAFGRAMKAFEESGDPASVLRSKVNGLICETKLLSEMGRRLVLINEICKLATRLDTLDDIILGGETLTSDGVRDYFSHEKARILSEIFDLSLKALSQERFEAAEKNFSELARIHGADRNADLQMEAELLQAFAKLYREADLSARVTAACSLIDKLPEIELLRSPSIPDITVKSSCVRSELQSLVAELRAYHSLDGDIRYNELLSSAAQLDDMSEDQLHIYPLAIKDAHNKSAHERAMYLRGLAYYDRAVCAAAYDCDQALALAADALRCFESCGDTKHAKVTSEVIASLNLKGQCWVCDREVQGLKLGYGLFEPSPEFQAIIKELRRGNPDKPLPSTALAICRTCQQIIESISVDSLSKSLDAALKQLESSFKGYQGSIATQSQSALASVRQEASKSQAELANQIAIAKKELHDIGSKLSQHIEQRMSSLEADLQRTASANQANISKLASDVGGINTRVALLTAGGLFEGLHKIPKLSQEVENLQYLAKENARVVEKLASVVNDLAQKVDRLSSR